VPGALSVESSGSSQHSDYASVPTVDMALVPLLVIPNFFAKIKYSSYV
jgi:hypothetical protein